jgi:hypothetical protein
MSETNHQETDAGTPQALRGADAECVVALKAAPNPGPKPKFGDEEVARLEAVLNFDCN